MEVVAIIPARYGSTRLDGKPLLDIAGKPMIQWVYERARKSRFVKDVLVATDDTRISSVVEGFGGKAVLTSLLHPSGTDRLAEVAAGLKAGIIVNVQGDEPLIEPEMMDEAIKPLLNNSELLMATLRTRITREEELNDPNVVKVVTDKDGFALYFSRLPIPYAREKGQEKVRAPLHYKHIGLYVYRRDFLLEFSKMKPTPLEQAEKLEQLRALENGYKIKVVETRHQSFGVDTQEDLEKVRRLVASQ